jgi:hypothetical protein
MSSFTNVLADARPRSRRGEVDLLKPPGGRPGEVMVLSREHAFTVPPKGKRIRAIPRGELHRMAVTHRVTLIGATALTVSWGLVLAALLWGRLFTGALLAGGVAAILIVMAMLTEVVFAAEPIVVGPDHPLAEEAMAALASATGQVPRTESPSRSHRSGSRRLDHASLELRSS